MPMIHYLHPANKLVRAAPIGRLIDFPKEIAANCFDNWWVVSVGFFFYAEVLFWGGQNYFSTFFYF